MSADVPCLREIFDLDFRTVCGRFVSVFIQCFETEVHAALCYLWFAPVHIVLAY